MLINNHFEKKEEDSCGVATNYYIASSSELDLDLKLACQKCLGECGNELGARLLICCWLAANSLSELANSLSENNDKN